MNLPWYTAFRPKEFWSLLKAAAADWSHDRAPRLGAALAYYTVFSLVPLLIVIIAIIGLVFGQEAAQGAIIEQVSNLVGEQSAAAKRGLDPNVWFQNVEYVAAEKIGQETVTYVSNIFKYYIAYRLVLESRAATKEAVEKIAGDNQIETQSL